MSDSDLNDSKMPLLDHLVELRQRLVITFAGFIVAFLAAYGVSEYIFNFLVAPLADLTEGQEGRRLIYTALHEAFFTYIKVAFFAAACVSFPVIATQIWGFVAPGLYKSEKKAFLPFLIATPVLFTMGAAMVYYLVIPLAWKFFLSFEQAGADGSLPIMLEPKVDQYLSLVMRLIFAFGVSFELPVLIILLAKMGLATSTGLAAKRKYAILIAFVVAAILTPPDVISQVLLAFPIIILYEISIVCARYIEKNRAKEAGEDEDDWDDDDDDDDDDETVLERG
ncbi:MAG: twin-arginine translocase subunit TatC [Rhodospirillaceae bacterium]|jgi:sec-independent protein translocase protein TatC|nr:twin-arginine translocase subunit TatC [Rhodospirillaceae bacterium]MBT6136298.1 twin-arginine translocase subunit TatC [Rhodospirillaceae bacterium]